MVFGRTKVPTVAPDDLARLREEGAALIDVRTMPEWQAGHLPDASHLPMDQLAGRASEIDPHRLTVVVCRSGQRSASVTAALVANGFNAVNLGGGLLACRRSGEPLVAADGSAGTVLR